MSFKRGSRQCELMRCSFTVGIVVTPRRRRKHQKIGSEDLDGFVALSVPLVLAIVLADADDGFRFHRSSA
ncbi:MAG: hypothetical protein WBX95_09220 [Xanthobacteraceae bacterium]